MLRGGRIVGTRPLSGGFRNENTLLVTDVGDKFVLRRFRHDNTCAVEAALARRVAGVVPVADVIATDPVGASTGAPTMVCRFVPGVLLSEVLGTLPDDETRQLGDAVGAALAAIGTVAFDRPGMFTGPDLVPDPTGMPLAADLPAFVRHCLDNDNAQRAFTTAEQDAVHRHAEQCAGTLAPLHGARRLVHSDFNPKNLLVTRQGSAWAVAAVLDWEFAYSGSPLADVGNMLRDEPPAPFADGFTTGFGAAGGELPGNWRQLSQALDLFALADLLTRPPDNPFFGKAVTLVRRRLRHA